MANSVALGNGSEDTPIKINISVSTKNAPLHSATETRVHGLPAGSWLTKGRPDNGSTAWILRHNDLGLLFINLPAHISGIFPITVATSLCAQKNRTLLAKGMLDLLVHPITDGGEIEIIGPFSSRECVEKGDKQFRMIIAVNLTDNDGSEKVEFLEITGIPKSVVMQPGRFLGNEMAYILFPNELNRNITLRTETTFPKFRLTIDAKIREKETRVTNSVMKQVTVHLCNSGFQSDAGTPGISQQTFETNPNLHVVADTTRAFGSTIKISLLLFLVLSTCCLPLL